MAIQIALRMTSLARWCQQCGLGDDEVSLVKSDGGYTCKECLGDPPEKRAQKGILLCLGYAIFLAGGICALVYYFSHRG